MSEAAAALDFEKAARLRDRISALSAIQGEQSVNPRSIAEADVFAVTEEAGQFCVEVFFFRTYQNWGNRAYFPRADRALAPEEVLDAFLAQFYLDRPAPRLVLLSHAVPSAGTLCEVLSARAGHRIAIGAPRRGEKKDLVDAALRNAREALSRKLAEAASQEKLIEALAKAFGVDHPIRRIEVYDNSHIMGTNAIGAMVVAGPEGFVKNQYRTFNIKSADLTPGRRLRDDARSADAPRLRGSCARARRPRPAPFPIRPTSSSSTADAGSSRPRARSWARSASRACGSSRSPRAPTATPGARRSSSRGGSRSGCRPRDPALFFIQRLRDEAHRFAIGTHRARRKKEFVQEPARRNPRHRPVAQAGAPVRLRLGQGRRPRRPRRSRKDAGPQRRDGEAGV